MKIAKKQTNSMLLGLREYILSDFRLEVTAISRFKIKIVEQNF